MGIQNGVRNCFVGLAHTSPFLKLGPSLTQSHAYKHHLILFFGGLIWGLSYHFKQNNIKWETLTIYD